MNFFSGRVFTHSTGEGGDASLRVRSLANKEGLNQHRVHHPLTVESRWWATHEGKKVINQTVGI
jgi:hypothetical protein